MNDGQERNHRWSHYCTSLQERRRGRWEEERLGCNGEVLIEAVCVRRRKRRRMRGEAGIE